MILLPNEYLYQNKKKIEIWYISEREKISKEKQKMKSEANIYFSYSCKSMFKILFFNFLRRNKLRLYAYAG